MGGWTNYPLRFEAENGVLAAKLPEEVLPLMKQITGCLPWANGRWGLLYCKEELYEKGLRKLEDKLKEKALIAYAACEIPHVPEIDEAGRLCIPRAAARFARISQNAVLSRLTENCFLLFAEMEE